MRYRAGILGMAAVALAASTIAVAGGAQARTPWCSTSQLRLDVTSGEELASNLRTALITLRNESSETCATQGYPGVDMSASSGGVQHIPRNGAVGKPIQLAPHQSATATLTYMFGATDWIVDEIIVTPPDNTVSLRAVWDWRRLGAVTFAQPGAVEISPLRS
ncbi:DUF4232 domain-containing protein [Nocardia yamanashiensis]|uniref:DUF4232 domain-containing protein n=1 Tax=Nocardia yamanashiensis TaxID=209247 RepID=UPI001E4E3508|nr:DUF4232 domain-containing protein [Nocardia yamanashiensis]UGT39725.1 DUF4232 domain-containing protein [Nocardia yamanashiensis]